MTALSRGLGKGLDALFQNDSAQEDNQQQVQSISLAQIYPNPYQPRKEINTQGLHDLAQSIQSQGILQPIVLRTSPSDSESYEIVAGERRWRAAQLANFTYIPAIVRNISDQEALIIALVENLQREDLNPLEEARALCSLQTQLETNQEELAQKVGKSRSSVANSMRLLQLDDTTQDTLSRGEISTGHARCLLSITDLKARKELLDLILGSHLTVRQTEDLTSRWKENGTFCATEKQKDISKKAKGSAVNSDQFTFSLQKLLKMNIQNKVRVSGTEQKGRISLYYSSEEELNQLLQKMGIEQQ